MNEQSASDWFNGFLRKYKNDVSFVEEYMNLYFCEEILSVLQHKMILRSEFNEMMKWSKRKANKFWDGTLRLSTKDLAKIAIALEQDTIITLQNRK